MKNIQDDLKRLKENIDNAKNNLATLNGRKIELLKQLKKEHGLNSVDEVIKEIKELSKKITSLETQINTDYNDIKEKYDW
jgi:uncharacterized protein YlzI (FlbEa/FlbD family)